MAWDFSTEPEFEEKLAWMREFVREEIYPLEVLDFDWRQFREIAKPLMEKVKEQGLWAAHLDPELGGQGFGQVKLGLMHEILGASELAPPIFGNQAPDSGNSELIAIAGTPEQKERWMYPLLDGRLYSAFSMTEQGTGSDPKQFKTQAVRDGDEWVIDGTKWLVGNAERSDFHIVMVRTDLSPDADPHRTMSMIIVPTDTPGIEMRTLGLMHDTHHEGKLHSHSEVHYRGVRVPAENLLGEEGGAFVLAQKRLGPGRIHHCMRWVGVCRRAFDMMCERAVSKSVHGSLLSEKQTIQNWIADSAAEIQACRLMTLDAAHKIDQGDEARVEVSVIKFYAARVLHDVIDRAVQVHGARGLTDETPLAGMLAMARGARIYDGPDEVHRMVVARRILKSFAAGEPWRFE